MIPSRTDFDRMVEESDGLSHVKSNQDPEYWLGANGGEEPQSGFHALPCGYYNKDFVKQLAEGHIWVGEPGTADPLNAEMVYYCPGILYKPAPKDYGYSARCLRIDPSTLPAANDLPTVTTANINATNVHPTYAKCDGNVTAAGNSEVTERGFCYSNTNTTPIVGAVGCLSKLAADGGTNNFSSYVVGLTPSTTYHIRAFATNDKGTGYGEVKTFTTPSFESIANTFTANGIDFRMMPVEGGTFMIGTQNTDFDGDNFDFEAESGEQPVHEVTLSSYEISETEVTQALWQAVTGNNPSNYISTTDHLQCPVEKVSWDDVQTFLTTLNTLCADQLHNEHFALPTEAQWEFAARGGKNSVGYKYAGSDNINEVAWYMDNVVDNRPQPVKGKSANELGLYDMSGNVLEWCQDWYDNYSNTSQNNPQGPSASPFYMRVYRGGHFANSANTCRVAWRFCGDPEYKDGLTGFRLALVPGELPTVTTSAASNIEQTSADCGGEVTDAGSSNVTERGFCYSSTNKIPTINGTDCSKKTATTNEFTENVTNLQSLTIYYVRAYATNATGTGYGEIKTFATPGVFTVDDVEFTMIPVEGGTFKMGAQKTDPNGDNYDPEANWDASTESPVHDVTLSSFAIGETEVTQALWEAVMGNNPSSAKNAPDHLQRPVENVKGTELQGFIDELNTKCATQLNGRHFDLPTEAQWEFAARGGNLSQHYKYAGSNTIGDVAWYYDNSKTNSGHGRETHPVKGKAPNELGLYDMCGNVCEWCRDWYDDNYYQNSPSTDPVNTVEGSGNRAWRGGSFGHGYMYCSVSHREPNRNGGRDYTIGLRLVLLPN